MWLNKLCSFVKIRIERIVDYIDYTRRRIRSFCYMYSLGKVFFWCALGVFLAMWPHMCGYHRFLATVALGLMCLFLYSE